MYFANVVASGQLTRIMGNPGIDYRKSQLIYRYHTKMFSRENPGHNLIQLDFKYLFS